VSLDLAEVSPEGSHDPLLPNRPTHILRLRFAKSARANVSAKELKALKKLADGLLGYTAAQIAAAEKAGELIELVDDDGDEEEDSDA
jgi:RelE toxin of RelE / RelB toxin-antitoxin system